MHWTHPKPAIRGLGLCVALVAFALSYWQFGRHEERNLGREAALAQQAKPRLGHPEVPEAADAWREGLWAGRFQPPAVLVAGRTLKGERAYGVAGVFKLNGGEKLVVDLGTVAAEDVADVLAKLPFGLAAAGMHMNDDYREIGGLIQLATGQTGVEPVSGHGTRVWPGPSWASIVPALGSTLPVYLVAGEPGGSTKANTYLYGLTSGFEPVPPYDETSRYYAWQWAAIAVLGLVAAAPRPNVKTKMDAR